MCSTKHFIGHACGHQWLAIHEPCWPGYGFNYCRTFGNGTARPPSPVTVTPGFCPDCQAPGRYDFNQVRMILDIRRRCRWGVGPSRTDAGSRIPEITGDIATEKGHVNFLDLHAWRWRNAKTRYHGIWDRL
ncbi:hypothetical protein GGR50DRAFT_696492 [Xylaria sp. CBS 124048]|nr:hypothetical protein GGR50DRAFT_696492 [Xylaria sp. CBS 124048]